MKKYNPKAIEAKWQKQWLQKKTFVTTDAQKGRKKNVLFEFAYPSGVGLHMGHARPFVASDIVSRYYRSRGFSVLYATGWDAFGLPAENFAIKNGIHPSITTAKNIANAKKQMLSWGLGLDWSREINTTDPNYYKWTQWLFLQFFKAGLAYEATGPINWCPKDKCGLANEEVVAGACERCGTLVEKREMKQWFLRITAYAEKLLDGLKHLPEWPDMVKVQQENWIGKSIGAEIEFEIRNQKSEIRNQIKVFTTRPDTIFGATYLVVAPEHEIIQNKELRIENKEEIYKYIEQAKKKSELTRLDATKEKTGVELEGVKAINPATGEEIPVWVSDYVLGNYGTGAIMAVPAHDDRDFAFAKKFGLPVKVVVHPENNVNAEGQEKYLFKDDVVGYVQNYGNYSGNGILINSGKFSGMKSEEAIPKMAAEFGKPTTQYKLRDWLFSRQRYWGEPIPIVHCAVCAAQAVSGKQVSRKAESKDQLTALPAYGSTAYPKAEFYFPGDAYFADIARGYKTVETRSFDPSGENKAWAEIEVGDVVSIYNKKSKKKFLAEVEEIRLFKNFLELYKAKDWLEKTFPGKKFKNPIEVELAYKKIYKGYPEQVRRFGLAAWKIKIQTMPVAVKEKDLPLKLPQVKKYEPTGTGESPLAQVESWVNTVCPECKAPARRETNTMPQWAGSSWYWLRYTDPKNKTAFAAKDKLKFWTPVDIYFGGMEHTVLHLLYSRFWNLFMYDQKLVPTKEPYTKRVPHGIILGPDGDKMSKSKGNVVNPDEIVKKYGADTLRMYEMFLGPHEAQVAWNDQGVVGVRRFLDRVWAWAHDVASSELRVASVKKPVVKPARNTQYSNTQHVTDTEVERLLHKLIKKIGEDIENFRFNTCVSSFMEFLNSVKDLPVTVDQARKFLITLYPFAPHIVEELNQVLGGKKSVQMEEWPKFNPRLALDKSVTLVVQVNGKVREKIVVPLGSLESAVKEQVLKLDKVKNLIAGAEIKRIIFVQDRLINLLV